MRYTTFIPTARIFTRTSLCRYAIEFPVLWGKNARLAAFDTMKDRGE